MWLWGVLIIGRSLVRVQPGPWLRPRIAEPNISEWSGRQVAGWATLRHRLLLQPYGFERFSSGRPLGGLHRLGVDGAVSFAELERNGPAGLPSTAADVARHGGA